VTDKDPYTLKVQGYMAFFVLRQLEDVLMADKACCEELEQRVKELEVRTLVCGGSDVL